ncbi:MAG: hypothetical protein ACRDQA_14945 [Nocardioidaceae bacterium]
MTQPVPSGPDPGPIGEVREGMEVVDATGTRIGTVDTIKMGDPEAETAQGQGRGRKRDPLSRFASTFGPGEEPDLPPDLVDRLLRRGFVKVDSKGLLARDAYVEADRIDRVEGATVHLSVTRDELVVS